MKPEAHMPGARCFRTDLVARIFDFHLVFLEMLERLSQCRHVWQMERHVIECSRRGLAFVERDCDVVVANRYATFKLELLRQAESPLEPFRTFLRIAHRQSKMTDHT